MPSSCITRCFFNYTATTQTYTLSLHDAHPIFHAAHEIRRVQLVERRRKKLGGFRGGHAPQREQAGKDRKSTRLNSSHANISYAVFCLKKKKCDSHVLIVNPGDGELEYQGASMK